MLAFDEYPPLTNFSIAVFPPGEVAHAHQHEDMLEVFYVESGTGEIIIDDVDYLITPGSCIVVEPGERHELHNTSHDQVLVVIYFGLQQGSAAAPSS